MAECVQTFDGKHHWAPRRWPNKKQGARAEFINVLACVCGVACPDDLIPGVKAALAETAVEQERQRFRVVGPTHKDFGKKPKYQSRQT